MSAYRAIACEARPHRDRRARRSGAVGGQVVPLACAGGHLRVASGLTAADRAVLYVAETVEGVRLARGRRLAPARRQKVRRAVAVGGRSENIPDGFGARPCAADQVAPIGF